MIQGSREALVRSRWENVLAGGAVPGPGGSEAEGVRIPLQSPPAGTSEQPQWNRKLEVQDFDIAKLRMSPISKILSSVFYSAPLWQGQFLDVTLPCSMTHSWAHGHGITTISLLPLAQSSIPGIHCRNLEGAIVLDELILFFFFNSYFFLST